MTKLEWTLIGVITFLIIRKIWKTFREIGMMLSDDEDFARANNISPILGTEVLKRQVERERQIGLI